MSETAIVSACIAFFVALWGFLFWLIQRLVGRMDKLETALFGEDKSGGIATSLQVLSMQVKGISEEGIAREDRILKAIGQQGGAIQSQLAEIKAGANNANTRIDELFSKL